MPRMPLRANSAIMTRRSPRPSCHGGRIDFGEEVLEREVDHGADEGAVEPPITAEDKDDEHGRGAVEIERAQVHKGIGLG